MFEITDYSLKIILCVQIINSSIQIYLLKIKFYFIAKNYR